MNPILKNVIAVIVGLALGSAVNMALVMMSSSVIPPPVGADLTTPEGVKAAMSLMEPKHFIFPFLAHALGTLVGSFLALKIAATHNYRMALIVALFFFIGGFASVLMISSPIWFIFLDLVLAYFPMAWLANKIDK